MRVIDLLNKIANGEEVPKKIKWYDRWLCKELEFIFDERQKDYKEYGNSNYLFNNEFMTESLNDEVEIIEDTPKEDKKIKKLSEYIFVDGHSMVLKINEIIDRLNSDSNE